ncbi:MAG TPA: SpvB/TcaC N-terminal domain-containing protein, partial [Nannocystaceae bacterium]|nr:SpvB/TcaC N-terminal domain-containing protein [Nannocystaceae bacterium]
MKRPLLGAVAALALFGQSIAYAYPGDVFQTAGPVRAPERSSQSSPSVESGASVSDAGAALYAIPLPTAPSRGGLVPQLALTYASTNPIRGGVAMGWSLDIPNVSVDTSNGVARSVEFRASISRGRLVRVGQAQNPPSGFVGYEEYRAHEDPDGTRYVRVVVSGGDTEHWRAYLTDGRVFYFGETDASKDRPHAATGPGVWDGRYFVTRIVDRFGNRIDFAYEKVERNLDQFHDQVPVDIALTHVEYGANANAGLSHHARITFDYASYVDICPGDTSDVPIGARYDYRTGYPLYVGAQRLQEIRLDVKAQGAFVERRRLELGYDMEELQCANDPVHAPLRILTEITDTAIAPDGTATSKPPLSFFYGPREPELSEPYDGPALLGLGHGDSETHDGKAGGWPTLHSMLLDLDGDAVLDRLDADPQGDPQYCTANWQPGAADAVGGRFGWQTIPGLSPVLPVVPWANSNPGELGTRNDGTDLFFREECSLAGQFSQVRDDHELGKCGQSEVYQSYRFMDMTGDGLPDLVTAVDSERQYHPEEDPRLGAMAEACTIDEPPCTNTHTGERDICQTIAPPGKPIFADNENQPSCESGTSTSCSGDTCACCGLLTPVLSCHEGSCTCCAVGTVGCEAQGCGVGRHIDPYCSGGQSCPCVSDDGDNPMGAGSPDTRLPHNPTVPLSQFEQGREGEPAGSYECQQWPEIACDRYVLRIHENLGDGFFGPPVPVLAPIPLETDRPVSRLGSGPLVASSSWHGFVDIDGDGLLDAVHMPAFFFGDERFDLNNDFDFDDPGEGPPDHFQVFLGNGFDFVGPNDGPEGPAFEWRAPRLDPNGMPQRARVHLMGQRNHDAAQVAWGTNPPLPQDAPWKRESFELTTLHDMNGDGLPDYVDARFQDGSQAPRVYYNTGRGFETNERAGFGFRPLDVNNIGSTQSAAYELSHAGQTKYGFSRARIRMLDVDFDGLQDIVELPEVDLVENGSPFAFGSPGVVVHLNLGDRFRRVYPSIAHWTMRHWAAIAKINLMGQDSWRLATDVLDLDGDGLPEAVVNDEGPGDCTPKNDNYRDWQLCATTYNAYTQAQDGTMLRALARVEESSGATVHFSYAPVHATSERVPHAVWAVDELRIEPGVDADGGVAPALVTRYEHDAPVYNQDRTGQWGFRGFGVTEVTAPGGARTVTTRDHSLDYAGLVVERRVYDRPQDPTHAGTIETFEHELRSTLAVLGQLGTISAHVTDHRLRT